MFSASVPQALDVWSDFEAMLRREEGVGWGEARIYAYRLAGHSPSAALGNAESGLVREAKAEFAAEAARNLSELLALFCERNGCSAEVGGRPFDPKAGVEPFDWRVDVRIIPKDEEG